MAIFVVALHRGYMVAAAVPLYSILQEMKSLHCLNVSTTPLRQWGFRQCLPFSWTTLRGKQCRHPIAVMGVVDTFGQDLLTEATQNYLHFFLQN